MTFINLKSPPFLIILAICWLNLYTAKEFYIRTEATNVSYVCRESSGCDGSFDRPFPDFLKGLEFLLKVPLQEQDIEVYLLDSQILLSEEKLNSFFNGNPLQLAIEPYVNQQAGTTNQLKIVGCAFCDSNNNLIPMKSTKIHFQDIFFSFSVAGNMALKNLDIEFVLRDYEGNPKVFLEVVSRSPITSKLMIEGVKFSEISSSLNFTQFGSYMQITEGRFNLSMFETQFEISVSTTSYFKSAVVNSGLMALIVENRSVKLENTSLRISGTSKQMTKALLSFDQINLGIINTSLELSGSFEQFNILRASRSSILISILSIQLVDLELISGNICLLEASNNVKADKLLVSDSKKTVRNSSIINMLANNSLRLNEVTLKNYISDDSFLVRSGSNNFIVMTQITMQSTQCLLLGVQRDSFVRLSEAILESHKGALILFEFNNIGFISSLTVSSLESYQSNPPITIKSENHLILSKATFTKINYMDKGAVMKMIWVIFGDSGNRIFISNVIMTNIVSFMSGALCFQRNNSVYLKNIICNTTQSLTGSVLTADTLNFVSASNFTISQSKNIMEGLFYANSLNVLVICQIQSTKSESMFGSLLNLNNANVLSGCDIKGISLKASSSGGAVYLEKKNTVIMKKVQFTGSSTPTATITFAGVMYLNSNNSVIIVDFQCLNSESGLASVRMMYLLDVLIAMSLNRLHFDTTILMGCVSIHDGALTLDKLNTLFIKGLTAVNVLNSLDFPSVIFMSSLSNLKLQSVNIIDCMSDMGGVIIVDNNSTIKISDMLIDCLLCFYLPKQFSPLFFRINHLVLLERITMNNLNIAGNAGGGALLITAGVTLVIRDMHVTTSKASSGGLIDITIDNNHLDIQLLIANDITASNNGGVLRFYGKNNFLRLQNSKIYDFHSYGDGGLIYFMESGFSIYLKNVTLQDFSAENTGGGISGRSNGIVFIENCNFSRFSANYGGLISFYENCIIMFKNTIVFLGKANYKSGVVDTFSKTTLVVIESKFTDNWAQQGGVFSSSSRMLMLIIMSEFNFNIADTFGAVIQLKQESAILMTNSSTKGNLAKQGTFLFAEIGITIKINNCTFKDNLAKYLGGLLIIYDSSSIIFEGCVSMNDSVDLEKGGILMLMKSSKILIINSFIKDHGDFFILPTSENNEFSVMNCLFYHEKFHNRDSILFDSSKGNLFFLLNNKFVIKNGSLAKYFFRVEGTNFKLILEKNVVSSNFVFDAFISVNHQNYSIVCRNLSARDSSFSMFMDSFSFRKSKPKPSSVNISYSVIHLDKFKKDFISATELTNINLMSSRIIIDSSFESSLLRIYYTINEESFFYYWNKNNTTKNIGRTGECSTAEDSNNVKSSFLFTNNFVYSSNNFNERALFKKQQNSSFITLNENFKIITLSENFIFIQEVLFISFLQLHNPRIVLIANTSMIGTVFSGQNQKFIIRLDLSMTNCNILIEIQNSSFTSNKASKGGIISIYERDYKLNKITISLRNSTFKGNFAHEKGGLIFIERSNGSKYYNEKKFYQEPVRVQFSNVTMEKNKVTIPGSIYIETREPYQPTIEFSNITNVINDPVEVTYNCKNVYLLNDEKLPPNFKYPIQQLNISQKVQNGIMIEYPSVCYFSISGYDAFFNKLNLKLHLLQGEQLYIEDEDFGVTFVLRDDVLCAVVITKIDKKPVFGYQNTIKLNLKVMFPSLGMLTNSSQNFLVNFEFKKCDIGHIFDYKEGVCSPCPITQYSLSQNLESLTNCVVCSESDKFYCYGADMRSPKPDYWRLSDESRNFLRCPNPNSCKGDLDYFKNLTEKDCLNCSLLGQAKEFAIHVFWRNITSIGSCAKGYRGILCLECEEPAFSQEENYSCAFCELKYKFAVKIIGLLLGILLNISAVWKTMNINTYLEESTGEVSLDFNENTKMGFIIKILLQHLYIMAILKIYPWQLPPELNNVLTIVLGSSSQEYTETFSFGCLYNALGYNSMPKIHLKLIFIIIFFFIQIALIILIFLVIRSKKNKAPKKSPTPSISFTFIKSIIFIYFINFSINFMQPALDLMLCFDVGDRAQNQIKHVLIKDPGIDCFSEDNLYLVYRLSTPFIIFLASVPLYAIFSIFNSERRGTLRQLFGTLGAFFYTYDPKFYLFEFFVLIRRVGFIILKSTVLYFVIIDVIEASLLIIFVVLAFNYILHSYIRPYSHTFNVLNRIERRSFQTNVSNCVVTLLWFSNERTDLVKTILLIGYLLLTNLLFFSYLFLQYFTTLRVKLMMSLKKLKMEIDKRKSRATKFNSEILNNKAYSPSKSKSSGKKEFIKEKNPFKNEIQKLKNCMLLMQEHIIHLENIVKQSEYMRSQQFFDNSPLENNIQSGIFDEIIPEERGLEQNVPQSRNDRKSDNSLKEVRSRAQSALNEDKSRTHPASASLKRKAKNPLLITVEHHWLYGISSYMNYLDLVLLVENPGLAIDFRKVDIEIVQKGWILRRFDVQDFSSQAGKTRIDLGIHMIGNSLNFEEEDSLLLSFQHKINSLYHQEFELPLKLTKQFLILPTKREISEGYIAEISDLNPAAIKPLIKSKWLSLSQNLAVSHPTGFDEKNRRGFFDLVFPFKKQEKEGPKYSTVLYEYDQEKEAIALKSKDLVSTDVDFMTSVINRFLRTSDLEFYYI